MNKRNCIFTSLILAASLGAAGCGKGPDTAGTHQTDGTAAAPKANYPLTVTDGTGKQVVISKQPQHIASVTLGTDEILSELVPKEAISLVTIYATDPSQSNIVEFAKGIPQIKDANAEQIIAAHPDLALLASYTKAGVLDQVKQAGMSAYLFGNFNSIQDIESNIQVVGKLVGNESKAGEMVSKLEQQLQAVKDAVKDQKKVTVLDYSSYGFAAGTDTTVNEMITDAGGTNAAQDLKGWQKVTEEQVVKLNPDVIIYPSNDKGFDQKLMNSPALKTVNAVKNHRIYGIESAHLTSVSQFVIKGVQDVAHVLYPDAKIGQ